jgi:hypothetical protein
MSASSIRAYLAAIALLLAVLCPAPAWGVIHSAGVLDGPSNAILEVDGAAMAPDGTGGIVYRKEVDDVAHVFAVPFANGAWGTPVQVDNEDAYGASEPAIAAGEGGRLLVVWVQRRNISPKGVDLYELMSASLQPGASGFGPAIIVDPNVGEPNTGDISAVDPQLAMNPSGQAYVVYRVVTDGCGLGDSQSSLCPPGSSDQYVSVKVARFDYLSWSSLGAVNRAAQIPMRAPTASNAPAIGIDLEGNGVVAWQEPDSSGVARIWVRRLFGVVQGNVLQVSPETIAGRPVTSDAEAPAVGMSPYGEALVAFRIHGAVGSAVATTQLYTNTISSEFDLQASQLNGAIPVAGAAENDLGDPSAAVEKEGEFRVSWIQGQRVRELTGGTETVGSPVSIGSTSATRAPTTINPAGGGTTAWLAPAGAPAAVQVREDYAQGAFQFAQLGGSVPGPVDGLSFAGSGRGDALLGWTVGAPGQEEVVGDFVQAPPAPFLVSVPKGWVRGAGASISWEAPADAVAGVTYSVYVDGRPRLRGLPGLSARLPSAGLGDGVHRVQVLATDAAGQQTMSAASELKVAADAPIVRVELVDRGRGVRVAITDDGAAGVDDRALAISFGDGRHANRRARVVHVYARAGTYTITALVRDDAGNHATVHVHVRVR